ADKYELIEELATADGLSWYEVSNWARTEAQRCRHNLAYWRGRDWWGIGPGAHRHRDGLRAWNVKHPSRYARMLADDQLPVADSEQVSPRTVSLSGSCSSCASPTGSMWTRCRRRSSRRSPSTVTAGTWMPRPWPTGERC